jgi:hypothetical protein
MIDQCVRETETIDAVTSGAWPAACPADLRAHVTTCEVCGEAAAVAMAIHNDCQSAYAGVRVPSAGLVWWRAQLRARQDVAEAAGRPIAYAQAVAATVAAVLLFVLGGLLWPWLQASFSWVDSLSQQADLGRLWLPLAVTLGASLVLAPLVLLFVLSDD